MTTNDLKKELVRLRKKKGLSQNEVADKIKMPRSTYANRETEGGFDDDEMNALGDLLGNKKKLIELNNKILKFEDWRDIILNSTLDTMALQKAMARVLAEIISTQRGQSIEEALRNLLEDAEVERRLSPLRRS